MPSAFRLSFSALVRSTRTSLDVSQDEVAAAAGISRAYLASIETGRANPTLDVAERIAVALGLELRLVGGPIVLGPRQRDLVHARCSGYTHRRLVAAGLECRREVEIADDRLRGWIDILAFDRRTGMLVIVEIKTELSDVGRTERQVNWYERHAIDAARRWSWPVRRVTAWLLCLASAEVDTAIKSNREVMHLAFPARAPEMRRQLEGTDTLARRGLALIDPTRRRRDWLLQTVVDGRRGAAPYWDYADAARRMSGR